MGAAGVWNRNGDAGVVPDVKTILVNVYSALRTGHCIRSIAYSLFYEQYALLDSSDVHFTIHHDMVGGNEVITQPSF